MNKTILMILFCFATFNCLAIDFYQPGDTLWVWAKKGLNIREKPNAFSKILGKAKNGDPIVSLDFQDTSLPYAVEEIPKSVHSINDTEKVNCPRFELTGYWAKIKYKGIEGYVFDAYLSKLQTFMGHQYQVKSNEDFHVLSLKKHAKVLKQIGEYKFDEDDKKYVRYLFDTGNIIEISGGSGYWRKEMLFSNNLSIIEGYLIYAHTMKSETDILLEKGSDFLKFEIDTGFLIIKKLGSFLVIYEEHGC